jgi:DNA replication protein DnaC
MPDRVGDSAACPECGGRGWLVVPDGHAGSARLCECQKLGLVPRLIARSGVPPRYESCSLTSFKTLGKDQLARALALAKRYVDEFLDTAAQPDVASAGPGLGQLGALMPGLAARRAPFRHSGLLFVGPTGVGKTHLAVAVLLELIQRYAVIGRFVDFTSFIMQIQSTFDPGSPESKHDVLDPVMAAEVLVIDELGAQQPTPWVRDVLYLILNHRYTHRLPTIFTTNYRLETGPQRVSLDRPRDPLGAEESLSTRVSAVVLSRIYEMATPVAIESSDFRRDIKTPTIG